MVRDINGYYMVLCPEHRRANHQGYIKVHILVWERSHGKAIPDECIVHHLNGQIRDNRRENLKAMTQADHAEFHAFARRVAGTGRQGCPKGLLTQLMLEWDEKDATKRT